MKNLLKLIVVASALTVAGCKTLPDGSVAGFYGDDRLNAPIGSDELRAACADRAAGGVVVNTATYFANILTAVPGAVAGVELAKANPLTSNISARCHEQEAHDRK